MKNVAYSGTTSQSQYGVKTGTNYHQAFNSGCFLAGCTGILAAIMFLIAQEFQPVLLIGLMVLGFVSGWTGFYKYANGEHIE